MGLKVDLLDTDIRPSLKFHKFHMVRRGCDCDSLHLLLSRTIVLKYLNHISLACKTSGLSLSFLRLSTCVIISYMDKANKFKVY
jgi:hypothetical protein